jgi:hypothetical protein
MEKIFIRCEEKPKEDVTTSKTKENTNEKSSCFNARSSCSLFVVHGCKRGCAANSNVCHKNVRYCNRELPCDGQRAMYELPTEFSMFADDDEVR